MTPLILFRHPALMIPSYWRAVQRGKMQTSIHDEDWPVNASLAPLRLVYDWYASEAVCKASAIIVIDSDDLINSPEFPYHLASKLGIDPQYVTTSWQPKPRAERVDQGDMVSSFMSTIWDSAGIQRGERRDFEIDVVTEKEKLCEEFGDEIGDGLARYIDLAMDDYYYLRERRFRVEPSGQRRTENGRA